MNVKNPQFMLNKVFPDAGRVKGLSLGGWNSAIGNYTLVVLSSTQLQFVQLPRFRAWNGKSLPIPKVTTVLLASCHPTHQLGEGVLVVSVDSLEPTEKNFRFAVLCQPRSTEITVTPAMKERKSPGALTPVIFDNSRVVSPTAGATLPPKWTDKETRNAVARARKEIANAVRVSSQPFDESIMFTSPPVGKKKKIEVIFCTDLEQEAETSIATPASDVLDMSGRWLSHSPGRSVGSPLAGLEFLTGESPLQATPLGKRLHLPPTGRKNLFQTPHRGKMQSVQIVHPDQSAHLIIVTIEQRYQIPDQTPSFVAKTFLSPLPPRLSSFDAMDIKSMASPDARSQSSSEFCLSPSISNEQSRSGFMFSPSPAKHLTPSGADEKSISSSSLVMIVSSSSSPSVHVLGFALTDDDLAPTEMDASYDLQSPVVSHLNDSTSKYVVKSMALLDACSDKQLLQFRVLFASNEVPSRPPINLSLTEDCNIAFATLLCPLPATNNYPVVAAVPQELRDPVADKLDAIMSALCQFETNVSQRLDRMEHVIQENTSRITNMERLLAHT
jgi:hypothetical protein